MAQVIHMADHKKGGQPNRGKAGLVHFNKTELNQILSIYFRHVSKGEWRDYAIDQGQNKGMARFCIFRHANDKPLFTVVKMSGRGGYALYNSLRKLGQSQSLADVLALFNKPLKPV